MIPAGRPALRQSWRFGEEFALVQPRSCRLRRDDMRPLASGAAGANDRKLPAN